MAALNLADATCVARCGGLVWVPRLGGMHSAEHNGPTGLSVVYVSDVHWPDVVPTGVAGADV